MFVVFAMLVGAFLYGYIIGAVSAILSSQGEKRHQFTSAMDKLNAFMENRVLPSPLRYQLRQYFRYAAAPMDAFPTMQLCSYSSMLYRYSVPVLTSQFSHALSLTACKRSCACAEQSPRDANKQT